MLSKIMQYRKNYCSKLGTSLLQQSYLCQFAFQSDNSFLKTTSVSAFDPVSTHIPGSNAAKYAVGGIGWDGATTNRPGARFGPRAIRTASHMLMDAIHPHFNVSPHSHHLVDVGDLTLPNTSITAMRSALEPLAASLLQQYHMIWLGGDHSITLSLLREYKKKYQTPLAVIHFDAHCDTWTTHLGEPSGHGTWVYEAIQEGLVLPECFIQLGIRSSGIKEAREYVTDKGGIIYTARQLRGVHSSQDWSPILSTIQQRLEQYHSLPLYLSLDIDCLDPAFAPGTGTPEPGGLTTSQVLTFLEDSAAFPFIGMDCVEVSPPYDHAELTSNAAASFVWTYLCGRLSQQK